jgi:epoxyqueuosine reductase
MINKIKKFATENGLIYGCGSAEPFYEYADRLARKVPFVSFTAEERIDPSITLSGAKSLIALGLSYNKIYSKKDNSILRATLSEGAVGEDYHLIMERLLSQLGEILFADTAEKYLCFCDTGPLADAAVAVRCGLGCFGLNHAVINDRFGAMFFVGYIITTAEIAATNKPENNCTGCGACVRACPSGALKADGSFDYSCCVAYLTQQKGVISDELKAFMGTFIYGCDACRRNCPLTPKGENSDGCAYPDIEELLSLTNKGFNALYGNTAIGWRGKRTIARNALIALGNLKQSDGLPLIEPFLSSESEELRDAALWAKKQILNQR